MYLVYVHVARPFTTRNKQAYQKTCWTSFVTEIKMVFEPWSPGWQPQYLALRYQVIAKNENLVEYIKTSLVY